MLANIITFIVLSLFLPIVRKLHKILQANPVLSKQEVLRSKSKYLLFLKGFDDDSPEVPIKQENMPEQFSESHFLKSANKRIRTISVCTCQEAGNPNGPERVYINKNNWRQDVHDLMEKASKIVILVNDSSRCIQEIELSLEFINKTYYLIDERLKHEVALETISKRLGSYNLPMYTDSEHSFVMLHKTDSGQFESEPFSDSKDSYEKLIRTFFGGKDYSRVRTSPVLKTTLWVGCIFLIICLYVWALSNAYLFEMGIRLVFTFLFFALLAFYIVLYVNYLRNIRVRSLYMSQIHEYFSEKSPFEGIKLILKTIGGALVLTMLIAIIIVLITRKPTKVPSTDEGKYVVNGVSFNMKYVEGGTFTMGCTSGQSNGFTDADKPAHSVTVSDFCMGETEVTQELWNAVMGANQSKIGGDLLPVDDASWEDCQIFIRKLNALTGKTFRLPTEAEWEYAARGGKHQSKFKYSGSDNIDDVAWTPGNSNDRIHRVKAKLPNTLGLYDMSGGVAEWCSDWYGRYIDSAQVNPLGPSSGAEHVVRGGSHNSNNHNEYCVSYRSISTGSFSHGIGFRLVLSKAQGQTLRVFCVKGTKGQMLEYQIQDDHKTVSVIGIVGMKSPKTLVIPKTVTFEGKTYSVTAIGERAFKNCYKLKSVSIPNSVTSIGESAFESCSKLKTINIPNSVTTIGKGAFESCPSLVSVNIPNSVTSIGESAFEGCDNLTNINIPNSVTSIEKSTFERCSSLTTINIPSSVTSIGESAFSKCDTLASVNISNSVTSIGLKAFSGCKYLTTINIPDSITSIEWNAFQGCEKLTKPLYNATCFAHYPNGYEYELIKKGLFPDEPHTSEYTIPDGIRQIANGAFYKCNTLTIINIPNSVTTIGERAFVNCKKLTTINIPDSVTFIGEDAFSNCENLTSINISPNHPIYKVQKVGQVLQIVNKRTGEVICTTEHKFNMDWDF